MGQTTMEVREILQSNVFEVFDFDYCFYSDSNLAKENFEKKFLNHYYYNEIGAETVHRWKWMLKSRLDMIMPYYRQLYQTELRCKNIDFMVNKDYEETVIKEIIGTNINTSDSESTAGGTSTSKGSNINNGVSSVSLEKNNLTNVGENVDNSTNTSKAKSQDETNQRESNTVKGLGNIGVTSSAQLLEGWRSVLINIDQMIIDDLFDLFITIY